MTLRITLLLCCIAGLAASPQIPFPGPGRAPASAGGGTVTYDAATFGICGSGHTACTVSDTTLTIAHTTGSGTNRGIAVACTVSAGSATVMPNITTVTYATVSLSQLAKRDANYDTYIWTLPDGVQPATGANNAVITLAATVGGGVLACTVITTAGVNQTTAWTVSDCTGAGSGTTATCTLGASAAGDLVIVTECNGTSIGNPSGGVITRRAFGNDGGGACNSAGVGTAGGGTTAISWNNNGSDSWQILAAAFKAQ